MQSPASLSRDMTDTEELLRVVEGAAAKGSLSVHVQVYLERQAARLRRMVAFGLPAKAAEARVLREYVEIHR
jgi:hypothetical protein